MFLKNRERLAENCGRGKGAVLVNMNRHLGENRHVALCPKQVGK